MPLSANITIIQAQRAHNRLPAIKQQGQKKLENADSQPLTDPPAYFKLTRLKQLLVGTVLIGLYRIAW